METEQKEAKGSSSAVGGLLSLLVIGVFAWYFFGGGLTWQAGTELNRIQNQVAEDAVAQYQLARKSGDAIQVCVQAMSVAAAYLQAQDESNYLKWKGVEKTDCAKAGMPY